MSEGVIRLRWPTKTSFRMRVKRFRISSTESTTKSNKNISTLVSILSINLHPSLAKHLSALESSHVNVSVCLVLFSLYPLSVSLSRTRCLPVCLCLSVFVAVSIYVSVSVSVSLCLSVCLYVCLSVFSCPRLPLSLSFCSVSVSLCLSDSLSDSLSVCLYVCLCLYVSVCRSVPLSLSGSDHLLLSLSHSLTVCLTPDLSRFIVSNLQTAKRCHSAVIIDAHQMTECGHQRRC